MSGFKRIGIANCIALQKEADELYKMLKDEFEVHKINCYAKKILTRELLGGEVKGISCNPASQAEYLNNQNTEINISMGLCIGHDMLFNKKSNAPVTTIIVKDREFNHNPILALQKNTVNYSMCFSDPNH